MTKRRMPRVIVIDHQQGRLTVDGEDLLPGGYIAADPSVEVLDGALARVDLGIYAENVLIRTAGGGTKSPTAEDEAKRIVRKGLADVLTWIGESA